MHSMIDKLYTTQQSVMTPALLPEPPLTRELYVVSGLDARITSSKSAELGLTVNATTNASRRREAWVT